MKQKVHVMIILDDSVNCTGEIWMSARQYPQITVGNSFIDDFNSKEELQEICLKRIGDLDIKGEYQIVYYNPEEMSIDDLMSKF